MARTVACTPARHHASGRAGHRPPARRMVRRAAAASCLAAWALATQASLASDAVQPFSGDYAGSRRIALFTATAQARIELRRSTQYILYTMHSTVRWAFLKRQFYDCSVLRIEEDRMVPVEYVHADASDPALDVLTRFDWSERKATTQLGAGPNAAALELDWPTWDPMSFQVALIWLSQQRRPGETELHRVVERGVLKNHQVHFSGTVPMLRAGREVQAQEIVSHKDQGQVVLYLLPQPPWRPLRVSFEEVTMDLDGTSAMVVPEPLPEGLVPQCRAASPT